MAKVVISEEVIEKILTIVKLGLVQTLFPLLYVVTDKISYDHTVSTSISLTCCQTQAVKASCKRSDRIGSPLDEPNKDSSECMVETQFASRTIWIDKVMNSVSEIIAKTNRNYYSSVQI